MAEVNVGSLIDHDPRICGGRPKIAGTGVTVMRMAIWDQFHGKSAEQITAQYGHLSLAQVHAALAYFYANQAEVDSDIANEDAEYERLSVLERANQTKGRRHVELLEYLSNWYSAQAWRPAPHSSSVARAAYA